MMIEVLALVFTIIMGSAMLGSMIGVGGGFIIVPFLSIFVGFNVKEAVALSLLSIVANSLSATVIYVKEDLVNFKLGLLLETSTMIGAIVGANILLLINESLLEIIFGLVLILASYRMIKGASLKEPEELILTIKKKISGVSASFLAGLASGMLGIGGGLLKMPILVLLLSTPTRVAIGTSVFMISITTVTGAYIYFSNKLINFYYGAVAVIGAYLGAQIGSRLSLKVKTSQLKRIFGFILLIFSVIMILRGCGMPI